jgi:hypothetical protein
MKILFICSSLELGRDGVGDYTRRLAGECATHGHHCTVLALNDAHVTTESDTTEHELRIIRLPATEAWTERLASAREYLRLIDPDWVSWQLVAYGFHPRGFLPADLLRAAPSLRGAHCHVMLHELWLGLEVGSSWRQRALGWLQRRGVICLLDQLQPDCIQTSQGTYQEALCREGFETSVLPLFGNVPIASDLSPAGSPLVRWLPTNENDVGGVSLVAITFGTLHPQWKPAATISWFKETAHRLGRLPALVAVGRTGQRAAGILDEFRRHGIRVASTGELDGTAVSRLLRAADFGIAPHPWALIGKSGAAAAMLEHGLPVLVPRDDWQLRGSAHRDVSADPRLVRLTQLNPTETDRWLSARGEPASSLPATAGGLLDILQSLSARAGTPTT